MTKSKEVLGVESLESRKVCSADPLLYNQWALNAIGANNVSVSSSIEVVVAIIDSGMDLAHEDLKNNLWINPLDKIDGIDNDNNGYVDDINGWNFVDNNNRPQDNFYHGTHVAGIIGAVSNNGIGVAGVAPNVKIMPLKFQNDSGFGYTGAAISAINYAIKMKTMGVNIGVINLSFGGGTSYSTTFDSYIKRAGDNNIVVVMAAGNNSSNNDLTPRYPSSYKHNNTISVAGTNGDLSLGSYSNYGKNSVDIAAPGSDIVSTTLGNNYAYVTGTSMAASFVSGAVALLRSLDSYTAFQVKSALTSSAIHISSLAAKVGSGFLHIANSIKALRSMPLSAAVVAQPVISDRIVYGFSNISKKNISGWTHDSVNSSNKLTVQIFINNQMRYSVLANKGKGNEFKVSINPKHLTRKNNLVTVKIIDSLHQKETIAYSNYISK